MRNHHLLLVIVAFLFSSCFVVHSGSVSSGPLFDRKDRYVDIGEGKAKSVFVFGFGNLTKEDLVLKAKKNLHCNRPLTEDEYYANFTTSVTNKFILGFIHNTKVTVSADVMRSVDTSQERFGEKFKRLINSENHLQHAKTAQPMSADNENIFVQGDSVYYAGSESRYKLFTVLSVDKNNALLKALEQGEKNTLVPVESSLFFVKNKEMNGFKSGNLIVFDYEDAYTFPKRMDGVVLGISDKKILIRSEKGFFVCHQKN